MASKVKKLLYLFLTVYFHCFILFSLVFNYSLCYYTMYNNINSFQFCQWLVFLPMLRTSASQVEWVNLSDNPSPPPHPLTKNICAVLQHLKFYKICQNISMSIKALQRPTDHGQKAKLCFFLFSQQLFLLFLTYFLQREALTLQSQFSNPSGHSFSVTQPNQA